MPARHLIVDWIKVLDFTIFIYKTEILTGGNPIAVDRDSLLTVQPNLLNCGKFSSQDYSTIPKKVGNENELTVDKKVTPASPQLQLRQ